MRFVAEQSESRGGAQGIRVRSHFTFGRSLDQKKKKHREQNQKRLRRGKRRFCKRRNMVSLSWLLVVAVACARLPGFGSACLDRSQCDELNGEGETQDCIRRCVSAVQPEAPRLGALALEVSGDDGDLPLSVILAALVSENKIPESDLRGLSDARRSYSMEHFRWGKPTGRKRRPVKVFASSLEGGGSSERGFPALARRQLGLNKYKARDLKEGSRGQAPQRVGHKAQAPVSLPARKDGAYRMSHFRWGSPPPSKRNGSTMRQPRKKPKGQLDKLLRNIFLKDVQRSRMG
uniref:Pro-opiomelanocortin/corticotropin ACTH central region domain-containing protein n=2 Tax=Gasterosteus aculeatus aculeatus TaxID=481459 RepID=G3P6W6_GASAC